VVEAANGIEGFKYKLKDQEDNLEGAWCRTWDNVVELYAEAHLMRDIGKELMDYHRIPEIDLRKIIHKGNEETMIMAESLKRQFITSYGDESDRKNSLYNMNRVAGVLTDRMLDKNIVVEWDDSNEIFRWNFQHKTLLSLIWEKYAIDSYSGIKRPKICPICTNIHFGRGTYCTPECRIKRDNAERTK
jgi:hypothetical protein